MRIRKNAKNISAFLYTNTNVSNINVADECLHQKNINFCELNQSPWDIITFPSSSSSSSFHKFNNYEVDYNVNVAGYGSSIGSVEDFESMASKTTGFSENDNLTVRKNDCGEILGFKEGESSEIQEESKLCGERDEKGWQCGSVVTKGNTMCDFHLSEFQNCAVLTTQKKSRHGPGRMIGARPYRAKNRPTTNPHDYYYYSGFGPSWGKKRGATDNDMDIREENGKQTEPKMSEIRPMELDSIDDDDNEDNDEKGKFGILEKKRLKRKPVKERSLKSLM